MLSQKQDKGVSEISKVASNVSNWILKSSLSVEIWLLLRFNSFSCRRLPMLTSNSVRVFLLRLSISMFPNHATAASYLLAQFSKSSTVIFLRCKMSTSLWEGMLMLLLPRSRTSTEDMSNILVSSEKTIRFPCRLKKRSCGRPLMVNVWESSYLRSLYDMSAYFIVFYQFVGLKQRSIVWSTTGAG